ncbi:WhiB family transcriptional regulator [Kribbia dieselivorans]|uniref:WhiB family transcriptional regulator n=1 Tax=Kribbia dieselivorans TaxID=331526 RepID=UPI0008396F92|nr:WhiB family transcriptional regulator [Kribbia dieselivorans]
MTLSPITPTPPAWASDWATRGRCAHADPEALFVKGKDQRTAKVICQSCPVVAECLADALDHRTEFGVWGGMTERERRALLRRNPHVSSWAALFQRARADEAAAAHRLMA